MIVVLVPRSSRDGAHDAGRLCVPASAALGCLWWLPSGSEPCNNLLGLGEIFGSRAPKEQASGSFSDRHRHTELCGSAVDAVFHRGRVGALWNRCADCGLRQQLDVFLEGVIELRVHAETSAHAAGFVERHIFECDGGGSLGQQWSFLSSTSFVKLVRGIL
jgi:hypothetical protein